MYIALAVLAALIGLAVCGAAVFTAWYYQSCKRRAEEKEDRAEEAFPGNSLLLRWTVMDYAVVFLAAFGLLFLFADVLAVLRDRQSFPYYHYGYLLIGFVMSFIGLLLLVVRLFVLLRIVGAPSLPAPYHQDKPAQADQAEQGIKHGQ